MKFMYESKDSTDENIITITKLEKVKEEMSEFMGGIKRLKDEEESGKRQGGRHNWRTRVKDRLESVLWKLARPKNSGDVIKEYSAEDFYGLYLEYSELCTWIEDELNLEYPKDKPEFCSWCEMTVAVFNALKRDGDKDVKEMLTEIDDKIANSVLSSAESGVTKAQPSEFRLQVKGGIGHEVYTTKQDVPVSTTVNQLVFSSDYAVTPPKIPAGYLKGNERKGLISGSPRSETDILDTPAPRKLKSPESMAEPAPMPGEEPVQEIVNNPPPKKRGRPPKKTIQ